MWINSLCVLLAGLAITVSTIDAQTFDSPINIGQSGSYSFDSCALQPQYLLVDNAYELFGPATVFHITQRAYRYSPMRPWHVMLTPLGSYGSADMALWVCRSHVGNNLNQCVDGSDNYGNGVPEYATVPAIFGGYYVVVTTNIENSQPNCGPFVLSADHG